ncbi:MAG: ATP-binding protein [Alphaproteobacteria bacterium]|nr:ATP-binding protein [Alphaproteobacteria bacterium]
MQGEQLNLQVDKDHILALAKTSGIQALSELIWNSLDADATEVKVNFEKNAFDEYNFIIIEDNGNGVSYESAKVAFSKLGGSQKVNLVKSPKGRVYHGKNGRGRLRALTLGTILNFTSYYRKNHNIYSFTITIDNTNFGRISISEEQLIANYQKTGFMVDIQNVNYKVAEQAFSLENRRELMLIFANYHIDYPDFKIFINNEELSFYELMNHFEILNLKQEQHEFIFQITEWNFVNPPRFYLLDYNNIPVYSEPYNVKSHLNLSISLKSPYIDELSNLNQLPLYKNDEILLPVFNQIKELINVYLKKRSNTISNEFIDYLKDNHVYPYFIDSKNILVEIHQNFLNLIIYYLEIYHKGFKDSTLPNQKIILFLIKQTIETRPTEVYNILSEVIKIPKYRLNELKFFLNELNLTQQLTQYNLIVDRQNFIDEIESIVYKYNQPDYLQKRQQLHTMIQNDTWLFGDEYILGREDDDFKNELGRAIFQNLGRDALIEQVDLQSNIIMDAVPDICFYRTFENSNGTMEHLIIELKKPDFINSDDFIASYEYFSQHTIDQTKLDKKVNHWKFILICNEQKNSLKLSSGFEFRKYGQYAESEWHEFYVLTWEHVFDSARQKLKPALQYVQQQLQQNLPKLRTFRNKLQKKSL